MHHFCVAASWPDGKFFSQSLLFPALIPVLDPLCSAFPQHGGEGRADTGQVQAYCKSQSDLPLAFSPPPFQLELSLSLKRSY